MNTYDTYTAELQYRSDRVRQDIGRNRRPVRLPFGRSATQRTRTR
jgi:hypothetical protein